MDSSTGIQTNPKSTRLGPMPNNGSKNHRYVAIAAIIVLAVFLIFIFASYEGYVPFLKLSAAANPYYSVANVQQLSSAVSKLQNSSSPFNLSYSLLLSLSATSGASEFSFNLPVNGYIAHANPYTKETGDVDLGALVKEVGSLSKSINLSSFPKFLDTVNITLLSNSSSYGTLCIPFSMLASAENTSLSVIGSAVNDSKINNNSLLCVPLKASNITNSSAISGILSKSLTNVSNISQLNNYVQVKYLKSDSYNGNQCSLLDINTTSAFQSKYNSSMSFSFCFSNNYGVPLYGSFVLNLSKDSTAIGRLLNFPMNFSNIVLSAQLKSSFNSAPSSSAMAILPVGSYTLNDSIVSEILSELFLTRNTAAPTVQTPQALLSYLDSYFPGMRFIPENSYSNYYYFVSQNSSSGSTSPGIYMTFADGPSSYPNSSAIYSPGDLNISVGGFPGVETSSSYNGGSYIVTNTVVNGVQYTIDGFSVGNSYSKELNSSFTGMLKNINLSYIPQT